MSKIEEDLLHDEGFIEHAYQDHLGYWTIGIGRLIDERRGGGITMDEALYLLRNDIERVKKSLDRNIPWWRDLDEVRQRVLINMAFQLGVSGLLKFRNTLKYIEAGQYDLAAEEMMESLWATQTPKRAERLKRMMKNG